MYSHSGVFFRVHFPSLSIETVGKRIRFVHVLATVPFNKWSAPRGSQRVGERTREQYGAHQFENSGNHLEKLYVYT